MLNPGLNFSNVHINILVSVQMPTSMMKSEQDLHYTRVISASHLLLIKLCMLYENEYAKNSIRQTKLSHKKVR